MLLLLALAGPTHGFADDANAGPRLGKYKIFSYGAVGNAPLFLGSFVLEKDGVYRAFLAGDKAQGEGRYGFDSATKVVTWTSGPYQDVWGGEFTVEREGKTHKLRLKRTTIATNNTD